MQYQLMNGKHQKQQSKRRIARTRGVSSPLGTLWVSTVCLDNYGSRFETMIGRGATYFDEYQWRYWTHHDAVERHRLIVAWIRAGMDGGPPQGPPFSSVAGLSKEGDR